MNKKLSIYETIHLINNIEKMYPIELWKINELEIWPIIRMKLCVYLTHEPCFNKNISENKVFRKSLRIFNEIYYTLKFSLIDYKHNIEQKSKYDILIASSNQNRTMELSNGLMYDINTDPFVDVFNENYKILNFERLNSYSPNLPRYSKSIFVNLLVLKSLILSKFYNVDNIKENLDDYSVFESFVEELGIPKSVVSIKKLKREIIFYSILAKQFESILIRKKIKLVLMVCYYNTINFALTLAANKLHIPTVDIQHGCAGGSNHYMYSKWEKIPSSGYKLMPTIFWCWDNSDAKAIEKWGYKGKRPFIIEGGRLIRRFWTNKDSKLFICYLKKLKKEYSIDDNINLILVTLQPFVDYPQWFSEVIKLKKDCIWIIREHPHSDDFQNKFMTKFITCNNVILMKGRDYPLEFLINLSKLHVTYSSSVIIDAEFFSVPSIMIDVNNKERYQQYIDKGILKVAGNIDKFMMSFEELIKFKNDCSNKNSEEKYNNAIKQLKNIAKI